MCFCFFLSVKNVFFEFLHAKPSSLSPLLEWRREWQDCSLGCMMTECLFCFSFVQLSFSRPKKMMTKRMLEASCSSDPSPFALLHYGQPSLFGLFFVLLSSEIPTILGEVCAPPRWGSPCKLKTHCMGQGTWALCKLWFWNLLLFSSQLNLIKHTQHIGPWSGLYPMPVDFVPSLLNRISPLIQISSSRCYATF